MFSKAHQFFGYPLRENSCFGGFFTEVVFALLLSVFQPEDEKVASRAGHESLIETWLQERMEAPSNKKLMFPWRWNMIFP